MLQTKITFTSILLILFMAISFSCSDEELLDQEPEIQLDEIPTETLSSIQSQLNSNVSLICSPSPVPPGYSILYYLDSPYCANSYVDYIGGYNAAYIVESGKPFIFSAGSGCNDRNCIWIKGKFFEDDAYVDIRPVNSNEIIASYRGSEINHYVELGNDIIT